MVLPEGCCFLAPHHHLCNTSQGGFCPFSFFFFGLYRKSLDQARRGADRQPLAQASPTASHSGQPGKARMSCLFVRAGSPHSCSTDLFLSDGTGARSGAVATVVQALQSVPGGGHRLPASLSVCFQPANSCVLRSVLTQLSWHHARCRARRYSKRLLLLLGWPSLSGTVQGQPAPGAKRSLSNLEGF